MFADARSVEDAATLRADVCIVGGGAAGIAMALEFIATPFRVVVLESGAFDFDQETQALYEGEVIGLPYADLHHPRLRYFGGTTNHWGGICRPFEDADFEARDGIRYTGWPIRKADLAPFYAAAAQVCRLSSTEWSLDEWANKTSLAPLQLNADRIISRVTQVVPRDLRSFGRNYQDELRKAQNVTVYLRANVTNVQTDEAGTTATALEVATLSGNRFAVEARQFVLATGAIENPRLLLASTDRWPNGLGNQHDLVGRFFSEHPRFIGGAIVPSDPSASMGFYDLHRVSGSILRGYLATAERFQFEQGLLDVQFRPEPVLQGEFDEVIDAPGVRSIKRLARNRRVGNSFSRDVTNVLTDLSTWQRFSVPAAPLPVPYPEVVGEVLGSSRRRAEQLIPQLLGDVAARGYVELAGAPIDTILVSTRLEQAPNPDSRVLLTGERDRLGMQRVALDWRLSEIDRRNARESLELLGAEVGAAGVGRLQILLDEDGKDWPEDLRGGSHLMGTTRMSSDPKQGVVDRDCLVHGMANLFVAGSSLFPTPTGGTPTLALVALALRLAEHIKGVMPG